MAEASGTIHVVSVVWLLDCTRLKCCVDENSEPAYRPQRAVMIRETLHVLALLVQD